MNNIFDHYKINKVIIYLTFSDIFTWGLYIVINAFVGIYLAEKLGTDALEIIGIGTAIYYFAKGSIQIPLGVLTDKIKKYKDDIIILFLGNVFMGFPFILYPLIENQYLYYVLQFIIGTGAAFNLVTWRKLFAGHLDKGREGLEYGTYDAVMSAAMAGFSTVAGMVANIGDAYFDAVMITIGILMFSSGLWVILIYRTSQSKKR